MKQFVIFVLLLAVLSRGDAKKVCILFEQRVVPTTTTVIDPVSVTISEPNSSVQAEIEITLGDISEVTEEISAVTAEATTETTGNVADTVSSASIAAESISKDICALEAITLFDDQNDLLRTLCAMKPAASSLYVVTVQNSVVKSDLSLATLCSEGARGLLSWISWQDFTEKVKPFLETEEVPALVVRNSSIGGAGESEHKVSEVLIEMLPIRYQLVNMRRSAWNNNTFIKTVTLGNMDLENPEDAPKHIEGELSYSFSIETNITFLSSYPISGLPVQLSDESDRRKDFLVGSGTSYLFTSTFSVERLVSAFKKESMSLKGTLGLHEYDIEGNIVSVFGVNSDGSTIEESHLISARVVSAETYDIKDTYDMEDCTTTTTASNKIPTYEELPIAIPHTNGPVYPGFRKFFYVALFLFLSTFSVAIISVIRTLRKERKAKKQGRRTYEKIAPKH